MGSVTKHGVERFTKRLGLPKKLAERLVEEALQNGHGQASYKGSFRKYLDRHGRTYMTSPIVYKGKIFIFGRDQALVTCWPVPQQFRHYKPYDANPE